MEFSERHPLFALYARLGWSLILLGLLWVSIGMLAGQHATPLVPHTSPAPWQLAWWEAFGWGNGLFLMAFGICLLVFRAARKQSILFGDRIRREYK
ncbi:MAG TPA: hypothetical protein VF850_00805 [Gemmatimonadaceae bacterium]